MVSYRIASGKQDMQHIVDLEINIWGVAERDAFPPLLLMLAQHQGGVVIVAEDVDEMVGFCFAAPARRDGKFCLWSYIAGIHPKYQGQNIGATLKYRQREWARENGYTSVHWTFDPLQARNANFNLNNLGAVARVYHHNIYGVMNDSINSFSMPSDRLEVVWDVNGQPDAAAPLSTDIQFILASDSGNPVMNADCDIPYMAIMLPHVPEDRLVEWQNAIRRAFEHAFAQGYEGYRFVRDELHPYYLLRPRT